MRDKIEGLHILSLTSQNASHLKKHRPAAGRQVHDRNESPSPSYEKQGVLHLSLPVCGPPARSVARQSPHRHRHGRQARSCQVSRPARARHRPFRCQSRASRRARQASARLCKLRRARARNDLRLKHLSEATKVSWRGPMKNHILPVLRHKLVADITVQDICEVLDHCGKRRRQSHRGSVDSWKRSSRSRSVKASTLARIPPLGKGIWRRTSRRRRGSIGANIRSLHHRGARRSAEGESSCRQARAQCFRLRRPHRHATS